MLAAIYWWIVFAEVYADVLFAGDANPAGQPLPDRQVLIRSSAIIVAGILGYAALLLLWRRGRSRFGRIA